MSWLPQGKSHDDWLISRAVQPDVDGRLPGHFYVRITSIDDPDKQGRLKAKYFWLQDEEAHEMETDWITRVVQYGGPTKMNRGRKFGMNMPHPEVGSLGLVACVGGDPHEMIYLGAPEYLQDDTGAPPTDKDDHIDWAFHMTLQNGFEWGIDTEGNEYKTTPGNYRHKILGSGHISARGILSFFAPMVRVFALGVIRLLGGNVNTLNAKTTEEAAQLREMMIDAMKAPPGRKDPGIGKVEDLE